MRNSDEKLTSGTKIIIPSVSPNSPLQKTYFRTRQIKNTFVESPSPKKDSLKNPPRRHLDFYSHQKAVISKISSIQPPNRRLTATNFFPKANLSSIEHNNTSRENVMRRTFNIPKPSLKINRPDSSGSSIQRKTSINFHHRQDLSQSNEQNSNYLNKYEILKELGKGTFSVVYLAKKRQASGETIFEAEMSKEKTQQLEAGYVGNSTMVTVGSQLDQQQQGQLVAIKVYQKFKMNRDPAKFKNIRKEINIMQNLSNGGILKLVESVETLTKISLVVEYGGQQSLLDYLKEHHPLSQETIRNISIQLIEAIAYLHDKNIVHRDIKLQNALINNGKVKLIDFGFSCLTHRSRKLNAICGTPNYMAPEILSRKQYIGEEADIWSYGVVIFALAEGRHPFKAQNYNQLERLVNKGKFQIKRMKNPLFSEFIRKILRIRGSERPRAKQILQMRWITEQFQ